jgi:carbon monoxide dehydrogenase subunit G
LRAGENPENQSAAPAAGRNESPDRRRAVCTKSYARCARIERAAAGARGETMKFTGDIVVDAAREVVFAKIRDARFFASCVQGVQDLNEIDADHYTAVLETKVAYLKFKFNVAVEVVRAEPPCQIEAKIQGTPLGIVGRLSASSLTRLTVENGATKVSYEVDAALTGKLGSLGQPVLRAKAKEMERQFAERIRAAFADSAAST